LFRSLRVPLIDLALLLPAVPVVACTGYLFGLTALSGRTEPPPYPDPRLKFVVVVPAHDEETSITATVKSLLAVDYPRDLFQVLVVADNCKDRTAEVARAAGATVLERSHATLRGKGYALQFAFDRILEEGAADAVVVVDADTEVTPNLLRAFAARFEDGASAVQAEYGVRNPEASWRTRLMHIALSTFHDLRSLGRERLGVSCGLRGNGMGFRAAVLKEVPHDAFSIVEDVEYGIRLGRAGHRVHYVHEARVLGEMVATEKESRSQRTRWEGGRWALMKLHGLPLLREAIQKGDKVLFDLAADVLVPPLSYVALATAAGCAASGFAVVFLGASPWVLVPWGASAAMLAAYVARGVVLSGSGARGFVDLATAPAYVGWKVALAIKTRATNAANGGKKSDEWVRTARVNERAPS
jgi:cellulose synthase/poly-beta-1,6-N-acetylglucosamine synthase-like glycosyltransferase